MSKHTFYVKFSLSQRDMGDEETLRRAEKSQRDFMKAQRSINTIESSTSMTLTANLLSTMAHGDVGEEASGHICGNYLKIRKINLFGDLLSTMAHSEDDFSNRRKITTDEITNLLSTMAHAVRRRRKS